MLTDKRGALFVTVFLSTVFLAFSLVNADASADEREKAEKSLPAAENNRQAIKLAEEEPEKKGAVEVKARQRVVYGFYPGGMVWIRGGTFLMGGSPGGEDKDADGSPGRKVTLSGYYIGEHEVTQREWKSVMGSNPSHFKGCADCPVENISWYDAVKFCNQLSIQADLKPCYRIDGQHVSWDRSANGYRLPTEAEWEYACRAGRTTRSYTRDSKAAWSQDGWWRWFGGNFERKTTPVMGEKANAFGLYDVHGNVWEWCWDWHSDYFHGSVTDPAGPSSGSKRVSRGGSWNRLARDHESPLRRSSSPGFRINYLGLRLARSAP